MHVYGVLQVQGAMHNADTVTRYPSGSIIGTITGNDIKVVGDIENYVIDGGMLGRDYLFKSDNYRDYLTVLTDKPLTLTQKQPHSRSMLALKSAGDITPNVTIHDMTLEDLYVSSNYNITVSGVNKIGTVGKESGSYPVTFTGGGAIELGLLSSPNQLANVVFDGIQLHIKGFSSNFNVDWSTISFNNSKVICDKNLGNCNINGGVTTVKGYINGAKISGNALVIAQFSNLPTAQDSMVIRGAPDGSYLRGEVYGTFELSEDVTIPEDKYLLVGEGDTLNIPSDRTLTNNGYLIYVDDGSIRGTVAGAGKTLKQVEGTANIALTNISGEEQEQFAAGDTVQLKLLVESPDVALDGQASSEQNVRFKVVEGYSAKLDETVPLTIDQGLATAVIKYPYSGAFSSPAVTVYLPDYVIIGGFAIKPNVNPTKSIVYVRSNETITLKDTTVPFTGQPQGIDAIIGNPELSGRTLTHRYYLDQDCMVKTSPANSGATAEGGRPVVAGRYYVKAQISANAYFNAAESNIAMLVITPLKPPTVTLTLPRGTEYTFTDKFEVNAAIQGVSSGEVRFYLNEVIGSKLLGIAKVDVDGKAVFEADTLDFPTPLAGTENKIYGVYHNGPLISQDEASVEFTLQSKPLSELVFLPIADQFLIVGGCKPHVYWQHGEQQVELDGKHTLITYMNNKTVGTASVVIAAKDGFGFTGEVTSNFSIIKSTEGGFRPSSSTCYGTYGNSVFFHYTLPQNHNGGTIQVMVGDLVLDTRSVSATDKTVNINIDTKLKKIPSGKSVITTTYQSGETTYTCSFDLLLQPKLLKHQGVIAKNRIYDSTNLVEVDSWGTLAGVVNGDDVQWNPPSYLSIGRGLGNNQFEVALFDGDKGILTGKDAQWYACGSITSSNPVTITPARVAVDLKVEKQAEVDVFAKVMATLGIGGYGDSYVLTATVNPVTPIALDKLDFKVGQTGGYLQTITVPMVGNKATVVHKLESSSFECTVEATYPSTRSAQRGLVEQSTVTQNFTQSKGTLKGDLSIEGTAQYGECLTVKYTGDERYLRYNWYIDGQEETPIASNTTSYVVGGEATGNRLKVKVSSNLYNEKVVVSDLVAKRIGLSPFATAVDDIQDLLGFTPAKGLWDPTLYEYSVDQGVSWTDVTQNPIYIGNKGIAVGSIHLRTKEAAGYTQSPSVYNTTPFTANIEGEVAIVGSPTYGQTLSVQLTNLNVQDDLQYQWSVDGKVVGSQATYVVSKEHVGKRVKVEVSSKLTNGTLVATSDTLQKRLLDLTTVKGADKVYDGTTNAQLEYDVVSLGMLQGDQIELVYQADFETADVGPSRNITIKSLSLAGIDKNLYILPAVEDLTLQATILRAPAPSAPTFHSMDDTYGVNVYRFNSLANTLYEYRISDGAWVDLQAADSITTVQVGNRSVPIGELQIRFKETSNVAAGAVLSNDTAFIPTVVGSVGISGTASYGSSVSAIVTPEEGQSGLTYHYSWMLGGQPLHKGQHYSITHRQSVGQKLTLKVTVEGYDGALECTTKSIGKRVITPSVSNVDRVYDGTNQAILTLTIQKVNQDDDIMVDSYTATYQQKDQGTSIPISITDYSVTGEHASLYTVEMPADIKGSILPRELVVTPMDVESYQHINDISEYNYQYETRGLVEGETLASIGAKVTMQNTVDKDVAGKYKLQANITLPAGTNYSAIAQEGTHTVLPYNVDLNTEVVDALPNLLTKPTVMITQDSMPEGVLIEDLVLAIYPTTNRDTKQLADALEGKPGYTNRMFYEISLINAKTKEKLQPQGEIKIFLPFPQAAGAQHSFRVMHLKQDGSVKEEIIPKTTTNGILFSVDSLSPFAVGWVRSSSSSSNENPSDDFWKQVEERINLASEGDVLVIDAQAYDQMPWTTMKALGSKLVTLVIRWQGGEEITIPAGSAHRPEDNRIYYPLSWLSQQYSNAVYVPHYNPATGGIGYIQGGEGSVEISGNIGYISANQTELATITPASAGISPVERTDKRNAGLLFAFTLILLLGGVWARLKAKHPKKE